MPNDSIWRGTKFANKTCDELEAYSSPENYPKFCRFLSNGIYSGDCVMEACCFCGGGVLAPNRCRNLQFSNLDGTNIDCTMIETSPSPSSFCDEFGNESFTTDGLTIAQACCVCGGGEKYLELDDPNSDFGGDSDSGGTSTNSGRKLQEDGSIQDRQEQNAGRDDDSLLSPPVTVGTPELKVDYTWRLGIGDSPGKLKLTRWKKEHSILHYVHLLYIALTLNEHILK